MKHFWVSSNHNYLWVVGLLFWITCVFGEENLITTEKLCDSRRDGIYGYKQCSNKFIYCINNVPTVAFCSEGTIFDEYSRECVHKSLAVYCRGRTENKNNEETTSSSKNDKSTTNSDPVMELDRMCITDNFVFSDNCSSIFWKCSNGVAHSFKCPNGLIYNDKTGGCGFADEVDSCKISDNTSGSRNFRKMSSNVAGDKLAKEFSYEVMNFERYCDNKEVGVYSFSNCSSRYYICGQNSFNIARCPLTYMFNPKTRRCESSDEYKCIPDHKEHTNKLLNGKYNCDGKVDGYYGFGGIYKDFYGCLNGEFFYYSCEKGLYFNPVSQYCEHLVKTKNSDGSGKDSKKFIMSYRKKSKTEFDCSNVPHGLYSLGCSPIYFSCEPNHTVMKRCSLGKVFNQKTLACSTFEECQTTIIEVEIDLIIHGVRCSNENEYKTFGCKPYYIYCCNGEQYLQYCAAGEVFDPKLGKCTSDHLCNIYDDRDESEVTTTTIAVPHCVPNERSPVGQCMPEYLECNREGQFVKHVCQGEEVFDHIKGFCRLPHECGKPIETNKGDGELCTPGKTKAIMSCHEFYFRCNDHGRQSIIQCSKGMLYDENFGYCRPENLCGKLIDVKPSTTTTVEPTTHKLKECKVGEVMVVAECGTAYTECGPDELFQIKMCPSGTGFDSRESRCVSLHRCGKTISETTTIKSVDTTTLDEHEVMCTPGELDIIYECSPNYLECNKDSRFTIRHCENDYLFDGVKKECLPHNVCGKLVTSTAPPKMLCRPGYAFAEIHCSEGYFHCSSLGQYESMRCYEGFVFDKYVKQCVKESFCSLHRPKTTTSLPFEKCSVGEILVISDCFHKYSKCNEYGEFQIIDCEKGFVFDATKKSCVSKKLCGLKDTPPLMTTTTQKTSEEDESVKCTAGTYEVIAECFKQYLKCNDFGRVEVKSCSDGYVFDLNYKSCVKEHLCGRHEIEEPTTPSTTTAVVEDESSKCTPGVYEIINECFQQFLQCSDSGRFEVKNCPKGFVFDSSCESCVDRKICGRKKTERPITSSTTTFKTPTTMETTTAVAEDQSNICIPGSYEYIGECFQQFLQCSDSGKFEINSCPVGFVFDINYGGCVEEYMCGQKVVEETTTPSTTTSSTTTTTTSSTTTFKTSTTTMVAEDQSSKCIPGTYEIISECFQQFLQCGDSGKFEIKSCPEGFVFDLKYRGCVDEYVCGQKETEETTTPSTTTFKTSTTTVIAEDQSSRCTPGTYEVIDECFEQFLQCSSSGKFEIISCPEGFVFDAKYEACVDRYVCGQKETEETTTPSTTTTFKTSTTTMVAEDQSNKCTPGTYEVIDECFQQFLQCDDSGKFEIKNCPQGLVFDLKYLRCIDEYICGNKEIEETTTLSTTTLQATTQPNQCIPGTYDIIGECFKQFLKCGKSGKYKVKRCPRGQVFDSNRKRCVDKNICGYPEVEVTTPTAVEDESSKCIPGTYETIDECFQQFLQCSDSGIFEIKNCPHGFVFDLTYKGCVDKYVCGHKEIEQTTTIRTTTAIEDSSIKCVPDTYEIIDKCSQQYLYCNNFGKIEVESCSVGFVFAFEIRGCVKKYLCNNHGYDETTFTPITQKTKFTTMRPVTTTTLPLKACKNGEIRELGKCYPAFLFCDLSNNFIVRSCGYGKVFDEKDLVCVNPEECGVEPVISTTTIKAPTCLPGDFMVGTNCVPSYFKCNQYGIFEMKTCYGNTVFDEDKKQCIDPSICGKLFQPTTEAPKEYCKLGSFIEIDLCYREYAYCDESGDYVIKHCPDNYVFTSKSNSCILKEKCESGFTTVAPTTTTTTECIVGSYKEISQCFKDYLKCVEPGIYVYENCESGLVFNRDTLSCTTLKECNGNDKGYGSDTVEGYRKPTWYDDHKPIPFGPETDHVVDKFNFVDHYPHDIHSILNTYHTKEELEGHGVKDEFLRNTHVPIRYSSPYDLDNNPDDLNLYEPLFSHGPIVSGYAPSHHDHHDDHDFVMDGFTGDAINHHFLDHRTNYAEEGEHDFILDKFLDRNEILHHDFEPYHSQHVPDHGHHYQVDEFLIPPESDFNDRFGIHHSHHPHHSDHHESHFNHEEPPYDDTYTSNFDVENYPETYDNIRYKRSTTDVEENGKEKKLNDKTSKNFEYYPIFDHSSHMAGSLKMFCNISINNLAPIGYCTEEFVNCTIPDDVFIQRCHGRNVFDRKSGECVPYEVCVNSRPVYNSRSLDFDNDVLDNKVCTELGDGVYYKEGCGKYFVVCNNSRMAHMHCPRDMYFDINRFQCDYLENIDACKHTVFREDEDRLEVPTPKFNCKNVPNGFIGAECSNVFAYCQNEIVKRKFRCPRNHVFDSASRLCVLPEMVHSCDDNPMFVDPQCASNPNKAFGTHCSSLIHHCLNGRHYTYPCGEDRFLNNLTMQCLPIREMRECEGKINFRGYEIEELENSCKISGVQNVAIDTCNKEYIRCLKSGKQLYVKCDGGLVFDEQANTCVPLDQCITKYSLNDKNNEATVPPTYIKKDESLLVVVDPICEGKKGNEFVATGMCKKEYIECIKTTAVRRSCENDYVFSKLKNSCVYKFTSSECEFPKFDNQQFTDDNEMPPFDSAKFCTGKENRFYRNPQNCTVAIRCYEQQTHAMYTCARGLVYDEENQKCDYAQKFQRCVGSEEIEPVLNITSDVECTIANHGLFIPDASDCTKYYRCVWGTLVEKKCPLNTRFNPKFSVCDTPSSPDSCEFK